MRSGTCRARKGGAMRDAVGWWHRLSTAGVLAVFAAAAGIGLRPTPGVALAPRMVPAAAAPAPPPAPPTAPGALLAPVSASRAVASGGSVAYTLLGSALTL